MFSCTIALIFEGSLKDEVIAKVKSDRYCFTTREDALEWGNDYGPELLEQAQDELNVDRFTLTIGEN